jgi:RNA polymerase sigma-70 factor (ECF subfamily)
MSRIRQELHHDYNILPNSLLLFIRGLHERIKFPGLRVQDGLWQGNRSMSDFHRLVEREIPRLRRYARALTRRADRADDLVQETLLRAIAKSHLWQPGTDIRAWLFTIMHNHYVNMVRRAVRDETTVDIEQISSSLVATTDPTASRQLWELERALGHLPEEQQEVILLVGLEGMSYDAAADILSVPVGTVRSRLSRGRDALRRLMGIPEKTEPAATLTRGQVPLAA